MLSDGFLSLILLQDVSPGQSWSKQAASLDTKMLKRALLSFSRMPSKGLAGVLRLAWALKPWPPGWERAIQHMCVWVTVAMKGLAVRDVLSEDRTQNSCSSYAVMGTPDKGAWPRSFIDIRQLCGLRQDTSPR